MILQILLGTFNKSRPARAIMKEFGKTSTESIPEELMENLKKVFDALNKLME